MSSLLWNVNDVQIYTFQTDLTIPSPNIYRHWTSHTLKWNGVMDCGLYYHPKMDYSTHSIAIIIHTYILLFFLFVASPGMKAWEDAVSSSLRCFTTLRELQEQDTKKFPISSNILWLASPVFLLHTKCNRLIESNCPEVPIFFRRTANWDSSFSKNTGISTTWEKPICAESHHSAGPSASRKAVIMFICQISHPNRDGL